MTNFKQVNIIAVVNKDATHVLMCKRTKEPYLGQLNFVGGKVKVNEAPIDGAYRELQEETSISKEDIHLETILFSKYYESKEELQFYFGKLSKDVEVIDEVNPLVWIDLNSDFKDGDRFAGDGIMEHLMILVKNKL